MRKGLTGKNAQAHGMWSTTPVQRVTLPETLTIPVLLDVAGYLADAALWLAETMAGGVTPDGKERHAALISPETAHKVGLYAKVAHELAQLQAEVAGGGLEKATLGALDEGAFSELQRAQRRALWLIANQIAGAVVYLRDRESIQGDVSHSEAAADILKYLAGHLRSAGRMIKQTAQNLQWAQRRDEGEQSATDILLMAAREAWHEDQNTQAGPGEGERDSQGMEGKPKP